MQPFRRTFRVFHADSYELETSSWMLEVGFYFQRDLVPNQKLLQSPWRLQARGRPEPQRESMEYCQEEDELSSVLPQG